MPAAGCGTDQSRGGEVTGDTLTIYTSLPLQGPHKTQSESIVNAEKLALREAGGKAGQFKVNFASRDDATAGDSRAAGWNPDRTADNASKAAQDSRTIGYIGELDSGATAISVPITNEAGFVQISPAATAVGLTKLVTGADKGEPDKFYPSEERTFARIVPADDVQASAAVTWSKQMGVRKVLLVDDKSVEGRGIVDQFRSAAGRIGLDIVDQAGMDPRSDNYRDLAKEIAGKHPDLVYFGGGFESNAVQFWKDLNGAAPDLRLMGPDRLLVPNFYARLGGAAGRTYLTSATQDPRQLPPRGRRFVRDYRKVFGERPDPYAAYGHTAMSLLLDVIRRSGKNASKRGEIVKQLFETRNFESVVGKFSIDQNGDTSLRKVAGYRVRGGRLSFAEPLQGEPAI